MKPMKPMTQNVQNHEMPYEMPYESPTHPTRDVRCLRNELELLRAGDVVRPEIVRWVRLSTGDIRKALAWSQPVDQRLVHLEKLSERRMCRKSLIVYIDIYSSMLFYMIIVFPRIRCHFIHMSIKRHSKTANSTYHQHMQHTQHTQNLSAFSGL